ncbi:MAG: hypothetical protein OEW21_00005 [Betaproteobacteria bacterium]|nr:hypothetical protein [Betaproteobacteria bacterium]
MSAAAPKPDDSFTVRMTDGVNIEMRRYGIGKGPCLVTTHGNGFAIDGYRVFWEPLPSSRQPSLTAAERLRLSTGGCRGASRVSIAWDPGQECPFMPAPGIARFAWSTVIALATAPYSTLRTRPRGCTATRHRRAAARRERGGSRPRPSAARSDALLHFPGPGP